MMASPKLSDDEKNCPVCKVPLKAVEDSVDVNYTKDVKEDTTVRVNFEKRPCWCWKCTDCGTTVTVTK